MRNSKVIYYILKNSSICEAYFIGGILSPIFAKFYFRLLCKKSPFNVYTLRKARLFDLIEELERS